MSTDDNTASDSFAIDQLAKLDNRVDELETKTQRQAEKIEDLEQQTKTLEARTDLLSLVEDSDEMDGMQRSVTLLQHLQKKAEAERKRGRSESAAIDKEGALEALHYPNIDRTTVYSDMRRCVRLVGDEEVCYYEGGNGARVVLNLENGDVPANFSTDGGASQ